MRFIEEHELKGIVRVISGLEAGSQSLTDAYHAADIFILPSVHEPFGIVILEAWASGLPVIASRVGGIPSFVIPHQDGLLFESNNSDSLVEVFKLLSDHPEEMLKIAEAGKRKASSQYSWDAITSRLINVYEEAIRENSLRQ